MATGSASSRCAKCEEVVGHGPDCTVCGGKFHFGCSGVTERGFDKLGTIRKNNWRCTSCRDSSTKQVIGTEDQIQNMGLDSGSDTAEVVKLILAKITGLETKFAVFQSVQTDIKQVVDDIADLRTSLHSRMDEIAEKVSSIESRVSSLESTRDELTDLRAVVAELVEKNAHSEQWVRRSNLQINGIPQKPGENLIEIVKSLAKLCAFPLDVRTDVDFVTRVAVMSNADSKKAKPIILKMLSRYKKDDFMASLRKLKDIRTSDLGFLGENGRIFVNDHLSSRNKSLLQQAKQRAKLKDYKYCWVRNCTIMVRRSESSPVLHITSEEALKKIT